MRTHPEFHVMARELRENGLDAEQAARHGFAFVAAKVSAVVLLCAKYGVGEVEMLEALMDSRNLGAEVGRLVRRIEVSPAYVGYIHSAYRF
jgi:hypothetical protein